MSSYVEESIATIKKDSWHIHRDHLIQIFRAFKVTERQHQQHHDQQQHHHH